MHNKKILTVQDLYQYLLIQNQNLLFSSLNNGYEISIATPGYFEVKEYKDDEGLIYCDLKAFHDLSNSNKSFIEQDVFKKRIKTMKDRPIMADIVDVEDKNGNIVKDFSGHSMYYDEEKNKTVYVEIPVGHVINPENIRVEYDEEYHRNFALADCVIYEEYTDTCDILRRREKVDCSVELCVREMSFDSSTKELRLDDYYVQGITLLGESILPGMKGSNVTLKDFSMENNSIYFDKTQLINEITTAVIQRLSDKQADFAEAKTTRKEEMSVGKNKFETTKSDEVEVKINEAEAEVETAEEETPTTSEALAADDTKLPIEEFDDNLSDSSNQEDPVEGDEDGQEQEPDPPTDEELADAVTDAIDALPETVGIADEPAINVAREGYDALTTEQKALVESTTVDKLEAAETALAAARSLEVQKIEDDDAPDWLKSENSLNYSVTIGNVTKEFAVSLRDKINAISILVNDTYGEADNTWYDVDVYEDDGKYCVMHDFWNDKHYKQEYSVKKDVYSLKGDRIQVFTQYLTADQIAKLDQMKSNYSAIETELNEYKTRELHAAREAVLASDDYSVLADFADFQDLKSRMDDYSVDELTKEADLLYAKFMKSNHSTFTAKNTKKNGVVFMSTGSESEEERLPYGGLFKNFKGKKNNQ